MERNRDGSDVFKQVVKRMCKINHISPQKPRFEWIENIMVISIKNHLKDGVDMDCFKILNLIYQVTGPLGVKFAQQLHLYPDSERLAKVTISFEKKEYEALNMEIESLVNN